MGYSVVILGGLILPLSLLGQTDSLSRQIQPLMKAEPVPESFLLKERPSSEAVPVQPAIRPLQQAPASEPRQLPPIETPRPSRETQNPENL